jgi:hypothetical protein
MHASRGSGAAAAALGLSGGPRRRGAQANSHSQGGMGGSDASLAPAHLRGAQGGEGGGGGGSRTGIATSESAAAAPAAATLESKVFDTGAEKERAAVAMESIVVGSECFESRMRSSLLTQWRRG